MALVVAIKVVMMPLVAFVLARYVFGVTGYRCWLSP